MKSKKFKFKLGENPQVPIGVTLAEIPGILPKGKPGTIVGVGDQIRAREVIKYALHNHLPHILQYSNGNFRSELESAGKMIHDPKHFFENPLSFVLPGFQGAPFVIPVYSSKQKGVFLQSLEKSLSEITGINSILSSILLIGDELFTNLVFNAPTSETGEHIYQKMNRESDIRLNLNEQGRVFVAHHEGHLVVGSQDPFGSLHPHQVLKRIEKCYAEGPSEAMNQGCGGAGIGFHMMFEQSSSLYIGVHNKVSTIVCAKMQLGQGRKGFEMTGKNLHVVEYGFIEDT